MTELTGLQTEQEKWVRKESRGRTARSQVNEQYKYSTKQDKTPTETKPPLKISKMCQVNVYKTATPVVSLAEKLTP